MAGAADKKRGGNCVPEQAGGLAHTAAAAHAGAAVWRIQRADPGAFGAVQPVQRDGGCGRSQGGGAGFGADHL